MVEIRSYTDRSGKNRFQTWFENLGGGVRARIAVSLVRLEYESFSNTKGVGGGTKKRQERDIEMAHALWNEYKAEWRAASASQQEL